jgi:hypothetical protein
MAEMSTATVSEIDEADLPLGLAQFPPGPELGIQLAMTEWSALSDRELVAAMDAARPPGHLDTIINAGGRR